MEPFRILANVLKWLAYGAVPFVLIAVIALLAPRLGSRFFRNAERLLGRIARQRGLSIILVGLFSFLLSASFSLFVRMPVPCVHDEFSYLLAADTFAHGRLANPPHPMWVHFETFWVLFHPTYASMYPPAQGLSLALGQVVCGLPIAGAWLSTALACSALCWMLMAWLPPRWALLGGFLAALHPLLFFWSQSYWGGSIAMAGGALVLGSLRRIMKEPQARDGWLMGLGMAVLANSRPFEGFVLCLICSSILLIWIFRTHRSSTGLVLKKVGLPMGVVLAFTAVWIGYYNFRVTGNALRMPEMIVKEEYTVAPIFFWQPLNPMPEYHHKEVRDVYTGLDLEPYKRQQTLKGWASELKRKLVLLDKGYPGAPGYDPFTVLRISQAMPLALLVLCLPRLWRNRGVRLAMLILGLFFLTILQVAWMLPHYVAPIAGLFFLIGLQTFRNINAWRWRGRSRQALSISGRFVAWAVVLLCVASFVFECVNLSRLPSWNRWAEYRAEICKEMEQAGTHILVIVRYAPNHDLHSEWVYNLANIDRSNVVWARDMGNQKNRELLEYYKDRHCYLLEADAAKPTLVPYHE